MIENGIGLLRTWTGTGGLLAGMAFLLAAPAWYVNSRIMDLTLEITMFLQQVKSGGEPGRESAARNLKASLFVLLFQFSGLLLFIGGIIAARSITSGTPWERTADFSDSHISVLLICFAVLYLYNQQFNALQKRRFHKEDLTATRKKMKPGQWGILITSLLLIILSPLYVPIYLVFYLSGILAAGLVFESRGKRDNNKEEGEKE